MEKCLFLGAFANLCSVLTTAAVAVAPPVLLLSAARLAVSVRVDPRRPPPPATARAPPRLRLAVPPEPPRLYLFRPCRQRITSYPRR